MKTHLRHRGGTACGYDGDRATRMPGKVTCHRCLSSEVMAVREIEWLNQPRRLRAA